MKKPLVIIGIVILCLIVLIILYFAVAHPIICKLYIPVDIHTGLDIYQKETYLQHEDGQRFQEHFTGLDFWQAGKVVDFYYGDNHAHDNPIYGKACDVFAIDIQLDEQTYQNVVSAIISSKEYSAYPEDYDNPEKAEYLPNGFIIWQPITLSGDKCSFLLATNPSKCIVRSIMVTDTEEYTEGYELLSILRARSLLLQNTEDAVASQPAIETTAPSTEILFTAMNN